MILNIATLVICLLMLILFRKLDKSNMRMSKLRRYSSKIFDDFKKMADRENRKFKDATIEMDILIKKSNSLTKNLSVSLKEIEDRLHGLDVEKTNLIKVDEDLKVVSRAAKEVNRQIKFIGAAREDFSVMSEKINTISENFEVIKGQGDELMQDFTNSLRERSREITGEMETQISEESGIIIEDLIKRVEDVARSVEGARDLESHIITFKQTITDLENTVFADIKEKSEDMMNDLNDNVDRVYGKINNAESNINESKDKLIATFQNEVERIRTEIDNLNIHTISKKDEIVQATRKEAEEIKNKISNFDEKYSELEERLVTTAMNKIKAIESEYNSFENRITRLKDIAEKDFFAMEERLAKIKNEILTYEAESNIFSKTEEMFKKTEDAVNNFQKILGDSRDEARELEKFFENIDSIKQIRKNVDREIRFYQGSKEKLANIEREVRGLAELVDVVQSRSDELQSDMSKIDSINAKISALTETYSNLEKRIHELQQYEDIISKNLDSINKSDILIKSIDGRIKSFQGIIDRTDKRVEKITEHLHKVEENTIFLKSRDSEIQEVKDKFNEIDGLSAHIEKRIDQIYAMFQKIETLRQEINETDNKLQDMFIETDRKMKQFADFIQAVDSNPIAKQFKSDISAARNINDSMINTIRELSSKGWSSDEIARKLLVDENSVRLIINTASL